MVTRVGIIDCKIDSDIEAFYKSLSNPLNLKEINSIKFLNDLCSKSLNMTV